MRKAHEDVEINGTRGLPGLRCGDNPPEHLTPPDHSPVASRTLIPREWKADVVRMSFTTPLVSFPVRWSCFCVMFTRSPGLMSMRF